MADIAIFHPFLDTKGGGEATCMRTIEALAPNHDLTVYSLKDIDVMYLNNQFNTNVESVSVGSFRRRDRAAHWGGNFLRKLTHLPMRRLQSAITYSFLDQQDHDLIISTYGEFGFETPAIQYINFPNFGPTLRSQSTTLVERLYASLCNAVHRGTEDQIKRSKLLTNSEWSADIIEDVYDVRPGVIYPPVDTSGFHPTPWEEREDGFVSVGRADRIKRPLLVFNIIEQLLNRGHDVHLHWLGSIPDTDYGRRVRDRADEIAAITLEGYVPYDDLARMVSNHKFALHGCEGEHFGIAVAEYVAGGAIPFVPDSGGQREIVAHSETLIYTDMEDALSKIERVRGVGPSAVSTELPDVKEKFGLERFRRQINAAVDDALDDITARRLESGRQTR